MIGHRAFAETSAMINLNRILHPTDFSDYSNPALKYACAFAEQFDAELHLIHVTPELAAVMPRPMGGYLPPGYPEEMKQRSENALAELPDKNWCQGRTVVRATIEGNPFLEVIRYAKEHEGQYPGKLADLAGADLLDETIKSLQAPWGHRGGLGLIIQPL